MAINLPSVVFPIGKPQISLNFYKGISSFLGLIIPNKVAYCRICKLFFQPESSELNFPWNLAFCKHVVIRKTSLQFSSLSLFLGIQDQFPQVCWEVSLDVFDLNYIILWTANRLKSGGAILIGLSLHLILYGLSASDKKHAWFGGTGKETKIILSSSSVRRNLKKNVSLIEKVGKQISPSSPGMTQCFWG